MHTVVTAFLGLAGLLGATGVMAQDGEPPAHPDLWGGRRLFSAQLSAGYQPTVTVSNGRGAARMDFDLASQTMNWEITYEGLTSAPRSITLHGPAQPGTNAAAIIDLGGGGLTSPVRGTVKVPAGQVQYMLLGWTYIQIATARYPDGELRGKVDVVPPEQWPR